MDELLENSGVLRILQPLFQLWKTDSSQFVTSIIGAVVILAVFVRVALLVFALIRPGNLQIYCHSESGSWALVTGASDGIGRAFSAALLSRGFNVLLHGRNEKKLERVKNELLEAYPKRAVDVVVADVSRQDNCYETVTRKAQELPGKLTILVNNVGGQTTHPQYQPLVDVTHEHLDITLNTNVRFATHLTKELLPILQKNGPSLILNCGSSGGTIGVPYLVTYSSCKAYIHAFSTSLKTELTAEHIDNVDVLGFIIGNVTSASNTHKMAWTITSDECATACLDKVGSPQSLVFSHWKHALQTWPISFLPERMLRNMVAVEMRKRRAAEMKDS